MELLWHADEPLSAYDLQEQTPTDYTTSVLGRFDEALRLEQLQGAEVLAGLIKNCARVIRLVNPGYPPSATNTPAYLSSFTDTFRNCTRLGGLTHSPLRLEP